MSLQIECDNGHRLICPESLAGSSVICPKCGSRVDVSARNLAKGGRAISQAAIDSLSDLHKNVSVVTSAAPPAVATTDVISFTCTNGHKLTGPRTLQGQMGECPKCKVKFRVPIIEWQTTSGPLRGQGGGTASDADDQAAQDTAIGLSAPSVPGIPPPHEDDDISLDELEEIDVPTLLAPRPAKAADSLPHPIEQVFTKLWREREHGGVVELHLDNGKPLVPDWWSAAHSSRSCGLFATQNNDGTYEIHAVAWSQVRRITVKGLKELPGGVFEGT